MPPTMNDREKAPYYAHFNGATVFVKEGEFFRSQGGLEKKWGSHWSPINARSIGDARRKFSRQIGHTLSHIYDNEE